jgi:hypothetical protein
MKFLKNFYVSAAIAATAIVTITSGVQASAVAPHLWKSYVNERFGTVAEYPSDLFTTATYSDNGDGVTLKSNSQATLLIFGGWNIDNSSPSTYERFLTHGDNRYRGVTYRLVKPHLLVLSGVSGTTIFYERYDFSEASGAIHAIVVQYPVARRATYDPLVGRISSALTWAKVHQR